MNTRFITTLAFSSLWALAPAALAANETGTDHASLVGDQGQVVGSWDLGFGFRAVATAGLAGVTVTFPNGDQTYLPGTNIASEVLLGNVNGSVPTPLRAPPMSVASLSAATLDVQTPDAPGLSLSPPGATMGGSFRVTVNVFPPRTVKGPGVLAVSVDGGPDQITAMDDWEAFAARDGQAFTVTFVENGAHSVVARLTHAGVDTVVEATWLLAAGDDASLRDTDGDGIGDATELFLSLDPFRNDLADDSDLDGWSDFDERLRGSLPDVASSVPVDTDGDGWSNLDETWRGTNPGLATSKPVARSLYAVEYLLTTETYADAAMSTPHGGEGIAFYASASGRALGFVAAPRSTSGLLNGPDGLSLLSVTEPWGLIVEDNGVLPNYVMGPTRVPGNESIIAAMRVNGIGLQLRRTWVGGTPDATPALIAALAANLEPDPSTDPLANYKEALSTYLVQPKTARQHPESALGVQLVASAVAWAARIDVGAPVMLSPSDGSACGEYRSRLGGRFEDLVRYGGAPIPGAPVAAALATAMWAPPEPDETTATAEARRLQRAAPGSDLGKLRYHSWLLAYSGLEAVLDYAIPIQPGIGTFPWDPDADSDLDGLSNEAELASGLDTATDPLYPDTDDDGYGDLADPCPRDASNLCLSDDALGSDTDLDGLIDALDNCWRVPNASQQDTNQDGIGDACDAAAQIVVPATDLDVLPGALVTLEAIASADAAPPVSMRWRVQGAQKGVGPVFSLTLDEAEWGGATVTVVLDAAASGGTPVEVDRRVFHIVDLAGPVPCLALDCSDGDPCTDDGCDLALGCEHTPIPGCEPCATASDCDDGNQCTAETCSGAGVCVRSKLVGTACSDGNACTAGDLCGASGCLPGAAVSCDDADPCTVESCVPAVGCVYQPDPTPDLVLCPQCTSDLECGAGTCVGGACCSGTVSRDVPFAWNPGDPDPILCLEAGTEIAIASSSSTSHRFQLFNPSGSSLGTSNTTTAPFLEFENPAVSGPYKLKLNATATATVTVHTSIDEVDVVPSFGTAFVTPVGTAGAEVSQQFEGTAGMRISFISEYGPGGCDTIKLLDPTGAVLFEQYGCGVIFSDLRVLPSDGTFTIHADNGVLSANAVSTTVWLVPAEPVVIAVAGGAQVSMPITAPGQNGTVEFVASTGDRISVLSSGLSCTQYRLFSPTGTELDAQYACGAVFREPLILTETGTYRWTVNPASTNTGTAKVNVYLLPPDPVVAGSIGGSAVAVAMPVPGQNGTITFDGVAGDRIAITFVKSGTGCPTTRLLSPSDAEIGYDYTCGTPYIDGTTLPETGTYRLTLNPSSSNAGTITATIRAVPADVVVAGSIGGGSYSVVVTAIAQGGALTFDALGGETVTFTSSHGASKTAAYRLRGPDGTVLYTKASASGSHTSTAVALPAAGSYRVEVDYAGTTIGTANISVTLAP